MASARSRSPLELPPRKSGHEPAQPRVAAPAETSAQMTSMPISFGVLLLSLGVTWFVCLILCGVLYRAAAVRGEELRHTTEQRLEREATQLRAALTSLQTQLDLRAQDLAEQARELERMSATLEGVRGARGVDARSARLRRDKHEGVVGARTRAFE